MPLRPSDADRPVFVLICGPNGSGKSTLTARLEFKGISNLVDPDAIAKDLSPDPAAAAIDAGRETILRCRRFLAAGESFVLETTLSGHTALAVLKAASERGYQTVVLFVCLNTPELNIERVRERVAQGGHHVPDADVRRRYPRSLKHAATALALAEQGVVFDNSGPAMAREFVVSSGRVTFIANDVPGWAGQILAAINKP